MKKLNIIYEDKEILVVNKPAKLLTVATDKEEMRTLYHEVREYLHKKNQKVFVVHKGLAEPTVVYVSFFLQMGYYVLRHFIRGSPLFQFVFYLPTAMFCARAICFRLVSQFVFRVLFHGLSAFIILSLPDKSFLNSTFLYPFLCSISTVSVPKRWFISEYRVPSGVNICFPMSAILS